MARLLPLLGPVLRISWDRKRDGQRALRAEGQVSGRWVDEMVSACKQALSAGDRLALDLSGVTYVDSRGTSALRTLRQTPGVTVERASPYVDEVLREEER